MLQQFLNESILAITDDAHFEKLKKSADEVSKKLLKSKAKVQSYTLSSLDTNASADSADIVEVKEIITKNWNTFLSNVKDTPLAYIRIVMLEALELVSKEALNASIIWYTAKNVVKFFPLIEKERKLIEGFLKTLGKKVEENAVIEWNIKPAVLSETFAKQINFAGIDKTKLENHLKAASTSATYGGENPGTTQNYDTWHTFFAKRATQGIVDESMLSIKSIGGKLSQNDNALSDFITEIQRNNQIQALRSQLIWWKECNYSESIGQSYDAVQNGALQLLLAHDYADMLPYLCPIAVDFFLLKAYKDISIDKDDTGTVKDFISLVLTSKDVLKGIFSEPTTESTKISFLEYIQGLVWDKYKDVDFESLLGINVDNKISYKEITLWLFHDNQVAKIINLKK